MPHWAKFSSWFKETIKLKVAGRKLLVCMRSHVRARTLQGVGDFLCEWVRKIFQKCACGFVCVCTHLMFGCALHICTLGLAISEDTK